MRALRLIDGTIIIPNFTLETELNTWHSRRVSHRAMAIIHFIIDIRLDFATTMHTSKGFSNHDITMARAACQLKAMLGHSSGGNFFNVVCLNFIKNCPITVHDKCNATHIFGYDVAYMRGKTTTHKSKPSCCRLYQNTIGTKGTE